MSEWRTRVKSSKWRYTIRKNAFGDCVYSLKAEVWPCAWEVFGEINMDCAAEGWGENIAKYIVNLHNKELNEATPPKE